MFIGVLVFVMAAMLLVNTTFLERFYELRLRRTLTHAYELIDAHIEQDSGVNSSYFENDFPEVERSGNISLVVTDLDFNTVIGGKDKGEELMLARLNAYSIGLDEGDATILDKTQGYTVQKKTDNKIQTDYLEMWGVLPHSGYHFLMRIPMESIRLSARISTEFVFYIILIAIFISILMIAWMSRRIAKPIRELTELSERMANLDFDAKYTSGGENEIGQLGEHFNRMNETLERTISELKTANNELQINLDEKIKVDDMRREFLSNVSHELKTPLALIQGYAEGLQDSVADDPESRDYYCGVIVDEAEKMNTLVKKLLTLNQIEFGNDKVEMVRFDLGELIRGKVASTKILAEKKGAVISYEGPETVEVWGDEFKVEEVLTNYLSNAINHVDDYENGANGTAGSGKDTDIQRRIVVKTEHAENTSLIRISVFNTGSHIPEEDLDLVWVKFFKVDKARTRAYGGSGVGLSIVKAIMDSFHQNYGVRNADGGVEFWFELEKAGGEQLSEAIEDCKRMDALKDRIDPEGAEARHRGDAAAEQKNRERYSAKTKKTRPEDEVVDAEWTFAETPPPADDKTKKK